MKRERDKIHHIVFVAHIPLGFDIDRACMASLNASTVPPLVLFGSSQGGGVGGTACRKLHFWFVSQRILLQFTRDRIADSGRQCSINRDVDFVTTKLFSFLSLYGQPLWRLIHTP